MKRDPAINAATDTESGHPHAVTERRDRTGTLTRRVNTARSVGTATDVRRARWSGVCALLATAAALAFGAAPVQAAWPERPVTIVVPYAPGGAADALARVVAQGLAQDLGTSVVVDNRPGASGSIGAAFVARAKPDGYTVLYDATPLSINPHLYGKLPYERSQLAPLSLISLMPNVLVVPVNSPYKDVAGLVETARAQPGKLNFASGGSGTVQRMAGELFRQRLDLDMVHVPYRSGGPAIADVMAGQVDFMFGTLAATSPLIASRKLRALAIGAEERAKLLPDVPTVAETVAPGYKAYEWNGVFVPAGTPDDITARLQRAFAQTLRTPDVSKRFTDIGAQPVGSTAEEFAKFLDGEDDTWGDVVRKGGIKAD